MLRLSTQTGVNVASMERGLLIVTAHDPRVRHDDGSAGSDQPPKTHPRSGVGLSLTTSDCWKVAEHLAPPASVQPVSAVALPATVASTLPLPCTESARTAVASSAGTVVTTGTTTSGTVVVGAAAAILVNFAVTDRATDIVTVHVAVVPEQAPVHPSNCHPESGVAVNVTEVPSANGAEQVPPELVQPVMPAGEEPTEPPEPSTVTVSVLSLGATYSNVAVTDFAADIVTSQGPEGLVHAPLHPENTQLVAAALVRVTTEDSSKDADADPAATRATPVGADVTVPEPTCVTVSVHTRTKVTVTDFAEVMVTAQVDAVPEHPPPLQELTPQPEAGVAVSTTEVWSSKSAFADPAAARLTPDGDEATPPDPTWVTDNAQNLTKVAVTDFASLIVTEHGDDEPVHAPVHAANRQPEAADALRLTDVSLSYEPAVAPAAANEIPESADVTAPDPACVTERMKVWMNVAVTDFAAVIETEHGLVEPLHAPVHAENRQPVAAEAARLTFVVSLNVVDALPAAASETPDGDDVTEPDPTWVTDNAQTLTNVAVTDFAAVTDTVHVLPAPEQPPPLHAETPHPEAGVAVRTTVVPVS
ncbi:MAG: hypothetical protein RLZZ305_1389 [Actinomycetota bacterium]|jgi:hypothetical protein